MIFSRTKKAFEIKYKTFFLVSQVLYFRLKKQTSKNVADTTCNSNSSDQFKLAEDAILLKKWDSSSKEKYQATCSHSSIFPKIRFHSNQ